MSFDETRVERTAARQLFTIAHYPAMLVASALFSVGVYASRAATMAAIFVINTSIVESTFYSAATFGVGLLPLALSGLPSFQRLSRQSPRKIYLVAAPILGSIIALTLTVAHSAPLMVLGVAILAIPALLERSVRESRIRTLLNPAQYSTAIRFESKILSATMVAGFAGGALVGAWNPGLAFPLISTIFVGSALLSCFGHRQAIPRPDSQRGRSGRELVRGIACISGTPALRSIALLVFAVAAASVIPEGLAAAWAAQVAGSYIPAQAMIMAASTIASIAGSTLANYVSRSAARRAMAIFALIPSAALALSALQPGLLGAVAIASLAGIGVGAFVSQANGLFVEALPVQLSGPAFLVMQFGLGLAQAGSIVLIGALARIVQLSLVIGVAGTVSGLAVSLLLFRLLRGDRWDQSIAVAKAMSSDAVKDSTRPQLDTRLLLRLLIGGQWGFWQTKTVDWIEVEHRVVQAGQHPNVERNLLLDVVQLRSQMAQRADWVSFAGRVPGLLMDGFVGLFWPWSRAGTVRELTSASREPIEDGLHSLFNELGEPPSDTGARDPSSDPQPIDGPNGATVGTGRRQ